MLLLTFSFVAVTLSLLMKSAFLPFRLSVTLLAPLSAVFGGAVLVYQKGAWEWSHIPAFEAKNGIDVHM